MPYIIKYKDGTEEKRVISHYSELRYLIEILHIIGYQKIKQ